MDRSHVILEHLWGELGVFLSWSVEEINLDAISWFVPHVCEMNSSIILGCLFQLFNSNRLIIKSFYLTNAVRSSRNTNCSQIG